MKCKVLILFLNLILGLRRQLSDEEQLHPLGWLTAARDSSQVNLILLILWHCTHMGTAIPQHTRSHGHRPTPTHMFTRVPLHPQHTHTCITPLKHTHSFVHRPTLNTRTHTYFHCSTPNTLTHVSLHPSTHAHNVSPHPQHACTRTHTHLQYPTLNTLTHVPPPIHTCINTQIKIKK